VAALFHGLSYGFAFAFGKLSVTIGVEVLQNGLSPSLFHLFALLRGWFALSLPVMPEFRFASVWSGVPGTMSLWPEVRVSADGATLVILLEPGWSLPAPLLPLALRVRMGHCGYRAREKHREDCCCLASCFHLSTSCSLFPGSHK